MAKIIAARPTITFTIEITPRADGTAEVNTRCDPQADVLGIAQAMLWIIGTWLQQIQVGQQMLVGQKQQEKGEHSV